MNRFVKARLLTASQRDQPAERAHPANSDDSPIVLEVSHEALIREWARLRDWLNEARGDVQFEHSLAQAAADWKTRGAKPDDDAYLFRGVRLTDARSWIERSDPTKDEADFVATSATRQADLIAQDERRKQELTTLEKTSKAAAE